MICGGPWDVQRWWLRHDYLRWLVETMDDTVDENMDDILSRLALKIAVYDHAILLNDLTR